MRLAILCVILAGLLIAHCAQAQSCLTVTAGNNLTLTWSAPTEYTDNSPIPSGTPITYNLYNGTVMIASGLTAPTSTRMALAVGNPLYAVTAVVAGIESAPSASLCVNVIAAPKVPQAPTGLKGQ